MNGRGRARRWLCAALVAAMTAVCVVPAGAGATTPPPAGVAGITGVVTDAVSGNPIPGVEVWLEKDAAIDVACFSSTVTDALGRYTFTDVPVGYQYWIKVNEQGGWSGYESAMMDYSGTVITHDFTLDKLPVAVMGKLTRAGDAVSGHKVKLWKVKDGGDESWVDYTYTGADGAFALHTDAAGVYHLTVYDRDYNVVFVGDQFDYDGTSTVVQDMDLDADAPERLADDTRYSTAVEIAREGFDPAGDTSWPGVRSIVLASGDDASAPDPLAAAGLCGALDAPMFLISKRAVPFDVKKAVKEIADANGTVTVYIVGGPASVPDARYYELKAFVGGERLAKVRLAGQDRYATAEKVAYKMKTLSGAPPVVLVANGADPTKFFDALSLSPVAAAKGYPILLVSANAVPVATKRAMGALRPGRVIVGGGVKTVSDTVKRSLGAERWSGSTRYSTATTIAKNAITSGWVSASKLGVAAKLPDALTGGSFCGSGGGVLLLTDGRELSPATAAFLESYDAKVAACYVFGGTASVSAKVQGQIAGRLALDVTGR